MPDGWRSDPSLKQFLFDNVTLDLPETFKAFLLQDGIYTGSPIPTSSIEWSDDDTDPDNKEDHPLDSKNSFVNFEEFHKKVSRIISRYGSCLAKVGSSTGKDAIWINTENSLRCTSSWEVYELLKASDRIALALNNGENQITLIKWAHLDLSMEFRCFVRNGVFIALCQRDDTVHYPHLKAALTSRTIMLLKNFVDSILSVKMADKPYFGKSFICDIYLDCLDDNDAGDDFSHVKIIDVEVWSETNISPMLFSWEELNSIASTANTNSTTNLSCTLPTVKIIERDEDCRLAYARYNINPIDVSQLPN